MTPQTLLHPFKYLLPALLLVLFAAPHAGAGVPCCSVVGIHGNVVTAREKATGKTFNFSVNNATTLSRIRVGQLFTADQRQQWSSGNTGAAGEASPTKRETSQSSATNTGSTGAASGRARKGGNDTLSGGPGNDDRANVSGNSGDTGDASATGRYRTKKSHSGDREASTIQATPSPTPGVGKKIKVRPR
jgi:hypothetical protein